MTLNEEKDIRDIVKRLEILDEHDREVVSITVNMLLAIQTVDASKEEKRDERREEKRDERREKEGSADKCTEGTPS